MIAARLAGLGRTGCAGEHAGLVELIVLGIGLDLGVISPTLFAVTAIMPLVTTAATSPTVRPLVRPERTE